MDPRIDAVLVFWFAPGIKDRWFVKDADFDALVRDRLQGAFVLAARGALDCWKTSAQGCLALCLLLDQVPRNLFRDDPRAFACDARARQVTRHALTQGFDAALSQVERGFLYLPLEHSEDLQDQALCCDLMRMLDEDPGWFDYAERHHAIIERFGRFPHRNAALGRDSSAEEIEFLKDPKASF